MMGIAKAFRVCVGQVMGVAAGRGVPLPGARAGENSLIGWAERSGRRTISEPRRGGLRFAFYRRVSTEDYQDPVTSRARQRDQAGALVAGSGQIVAEFFDAGQSRVLPWARRPQAAALLAAMADPDCPFGAIVVGEYERAFYGSQYAAMAPLFEHYGVQLWMPEAGGRVNFQAEGDEQLMLALGVQSKREITRTKIRVRTAMAAQARDQGRYLGGRPPYGYRLADAGPHPNKAHAAWGRRAHRLEPDPHTAPGRAVDVRPAPGRAQPGPHHPGAQRRAHPLPLSRRPSPQPAPRRNGVDAVHGAGGPGQPALHRPPGVEPPAHQQ
jgi:DNA invertase Pin-like site-specific DNA recombinase